MILITMITTITKIIIYRQRDEKYLQELISVFFWMTSANKSSKCFGIDFRKSKKRLIVFKANDKEE